MDPTEPDPLTGASLPSGGVNAEIQKRPILTPRGPRRNRGTVPDSITVGDPSSSARPPKRKSGPNAKSPPKRTKIAKRNSTEHEDQESSSESPSLVNASIPPRSTVGAPNNPQDGTQGAPGIPALPSPSLTPPQQAEDIPRPSEQPEGHQTSGPFKKCDRCSSLFELPLTSGIRRIPNMSQFTLNERMNLFCGRCFMRLSMCEAVFKKDRLHAEHKREVGQLKLPGEVMESRQFFYRSLAAVGDDVISAAGHPKTRELFDTEGESSSWSRIIGPLESTIAGKPKDDAEVDRSGETWRDEMDKWINMAAMMLVYHFFGQLNPSAFEWKCGGFCEFCKPELTERNALVLMQQALQRGDKELPGQPLSFDRLYTWRPFNPNGTSTKPPSYTSNIDGRADQEARASFSFAMQNRRSQVNFNDWVVEYDTWKGYGQALQDNIDMFNDLDD
ncbi:hypothetical protein QBC40DRAFT_260990 [Triangularia verruculosa]|uniref:Uncharacterized protein n=1 Tax=Triangularia verruculosa TaxID=2587418 RepID=A0AAN7AXT0_9PEZI|nr:hypothetical protein QBC40DRAFT_260990 [Triangularia verruculosa]